MTTWIVTRPDGAAGGDHLQAHELAAVLGTGARVVPPAEARPAAGDVVVLHNLQRCLGWGDLPERARRLGAAVVVVPLFHGIDAYHRGGRQGIDRIAARVIRAPLRFESWRQGTWDWTRRARDVLAFARLVGCADTELAELAALGLVAAQARVVPIGVPSADPAAPVGPSDDAVLFVGRLEPLKAPHLLRAACAAEGLPLVLVGSVPARHRRYGRVLAEGWRGPLPYPAVRSAMRSARVVAVASWAESWGRPTVEAALEGAAPVATAGRAADALEARGGRVWRAPPGDAEALRRALRAAWDAGRRVQPEATALTWTALADAWREALSP